MTGESPEPQKFPLDGFDLSRVSSETLIALFDTAPASHSYEGTRIVRISQSLIIKGGSGARPCEANILNIVAGIGKEGAGSEGSIAVPRVHRVIKVESERIFYGARCLLVMDFIDGPTVEACWDTLNQTEREDIVSQVASMINTLQSFELSSQQQDLPGPVGCKTCLARGFWFPDFGAGPFNSKEDLEAYFNRQLEISQLFNQAPDTVLPFSFERLVLTHQDIAPRNLILRPDGKVFLIDWGDAGIYPEGLEYAAFKARWYTAPEFTAMLLEKVRRYEEFEQHLQWIMFALTTGQWIGYDFSAHENDLP